MGFLAPAFFVGALAAALPLYLHLLRRNTTTPVPFSSLMFFDTRPQEAVRRRRLRYWLLLALRLAVLLLLVLAFTEPFLKRMGAGIEPAKLLLIAVDTSFSMQAGTRLADAQRAAMDVLGKRRRVDRAQVLALSARVRLLTQATLDQRALEAAVNQLLPGESRASFGALASAVRSIADTEHAPIELHVFSDLQKSDMPPSFAEMTLPENVALVLHQLAPAPTPNWTVESVTAPHQIWDPRSAHVQAVIAGFGTPAATRTVSFRCGNTVVATRQVQVAPSGRATAEINGLDLPYGFSRCSVAIDSADALHADDTFLFAIERAERTRGLFVSQTADTRSPLFFQTALTAASRGSAVLDLVSTDRAGAVDPSQYGFVVLSDVANLPDAFVSRLRAYVQRGGSVLITLGAVSAQEHAIPLFGGESIAPHVYSRTAERFAVVGAAENAYAAAGARGEWEGVHFYYTAGVDERGARVALRLQDGTPLLLEKTLGEGRVAVFASAFDNLTNDLPLHPEFVAFTGRLVRQLSGAPVDAGPRTVDDLVQLRTSREQAARVDVIDPSGHQALAMNDASSADAYRLDRSGFYDVRLATGRRDLIASNPDRRESDLAPIPADVLALWEGRRAGQGAAGAKAEAQAGAARTVAARVPVAFPLWWYAIFALLIAAVAEAVLGARYLTTLRSEP